MKKYILILIILTCLQGFFAQTTVISHVSNDYQNHFGWSISGTGNYVSISDPRDSINFYANGSVNIYKKNGSQWDFNQTLKSPNGKAYDYFGHRVCMNNDILAITAAGDNLKGFMAGAVHIYKLKNENWQHVQSIYQNSPAKLGQFGESLCINGQYLYVGAPGIDSTGAVFVYTMSEDTFSFVRKIKNPYPVNNMQFGKSVAAIHNKLFVGAPSPNKLQASGIVFIFTKTDVSWQHQHYDSIGVKSEPGSMFGYSISAENDKLLIGAPHANFFGALETYYFAGKAYYFKNIAGKYILQQEFANPEPASHDLFGSSVMIRDSIIFIASPKDNVSAVDQGTIFIYNRENDLWKHKSINSPDKSSNYFSSSFYVFNKQLFIGSGGNKTEKNKGKVLAYNVSQLLSINENDIENESIKLFPNPADKIFNINMKNKFRYSVTICSAEGKTIRKLEKSGNASFDVSDLANGHYIVYVKLKNQVITEQLIVLHNK